MAKLYCVPLGHSPRSLFYDKLQSVGYDKGVLVLPSRLLMHQAQREANIRTIDIDFLATTILNDNGYLNLKPINSRSQELVIKDLVKFLAQRDKLEYFEALAEKQGFIKALASLVRQLSRSGVTEVQIMNALENWGRTGNQGLKDWEISQLYALYRKYLKDNDWFDLEGKYRLAIKVLQEEKVKLRWQEVCISDFYTFDALQLEFIKALSKRTNVSVGLMYDAQNSEVLKAVENTYGALMNFCDLEKVSLLTSKAPENVRLCQFPDRELEMAWVLTEVKGLLRNGVDAKEILVTFRKFDNYNGLRRLADQYGIPVSIPQSSGLNLQPLAEFILLLLEAKPDNRLGAEAYFKLLTNGIGKLLLNVDGEAAHFWRQEKYFTTRSQVQAKCGESFIAEDSRLAIIDTALENLQATATVSEYGAVLEALLEGLDLERTLGAMHKQGALQYQDVKGCLQSKQLILQCLQSLGEDYRNCNLHEEKLTLQDFALTLGEAMADYQVALVDGRNDGVLITEVINAQGLEHKYVFLMGLREGEFPTGSNENWIYSDKERSELAGLGIDMPTSTLAYGEDAYFFASTVALAKESLVLTYHVDDKAGASAYVDEAKKKYNVNVENILSKEPASLGEACINGRKISFAWIIANLGPFVFAGSTVDSTRENFGVYRGVFKSEELSKEVEAFVGNVFSPSSLEVYAQCPFRFLGERVWKQKEFVEKEELAAPADEGSLLHATLAKFLGKHLQEKLLKYEFSLLWEELQKDFQEVCAEFVTNGTLEENELWEAERNRLLNVLRRWLSYEYELQGQWDFVPCAVEWDFSSKNGKPLRLSLPDGRSFAIMGRLDRIDKNGDKVFVTDYKLSTTPAGSDLPAGIDLQLPVYLLAASKLYGKKVAGGGYLSLKNTERKSTVKLDDIEFPFNKRSTDYFADAEDKWQVFSQFSQQLLQNYVQGIYEGNFDVLPKKNCSPYCPLKDICRVNLLEQGGEVDE